MAHFAEIDENGIVKQVIVVNNNILVNADGIELEAKGIAFCQTLFGGTWVQTSYSGKFRGTFAGVGCTYDKAKDIFVNPIQASMDQLQFTNIPTGNISV